jgi:glycosyltransferase involved in cell wall biosynthesis
MTLHPLMQSAKTEFDLTEPEHQRSLQQLTDRLLADPAVKSADLQAAARQPAAPLEFQMAAKLYQSRRFLQRNSRPLRVGVVFAMWGEQNRLRPKSAANPHGEDSLRTKIDQLAWATAETAITWTIYAVDDGCPHGSGTLAQEIAADHAPQHAVQVLFLAHHLPAAEGPLRNLPSADHSRKAGAIILGCQQALADGADVVIYTDADNSVHLGQIGLLLQPFLDQGYRVVLGNRKHPDAVLVKDAARWGIGIKNLRHMQRMIGEAIFSRNILDTQAAFKLYQRDLLQAIIADPTVFDFSFDTDWIAAFIARDEPFAQVPFAFLDSAAESATAKQQPMTTWETLLLGLLKALRRYELLRTPASREMAAVIDAEIADYRDLELIINHLPPELEEAGEADYGNPEILSARAFQAWVQQRKAAAHAI